MHLALPRLDHLLRRRVGLRLVELVLAVHRDLRGQLAGRHGRRESDLGQVVHEVVELLVLVALPVPLRLDLVLVVDGILPEQVIEHGLQVLGGALLLASLHGARLEQDGEGVSRVLPLLLRQLLGPPRGVALCGFLDKVLHCSVIINSGPVLPFYTLMFLVYLFK